MAFDFAKYIKAHPNFPKKGILFRDFIPLIKNGKALHAAINKIADFAKQQRAEIIAAPEARGFIVGAPVAYKLGIGFAPARKPKKLPTKVVSASYGSEYSKSQLSMEIGDVKPGQRVFITDDLLATGGTYRATAKLVHQLGGKVVGAAFVIELKALNGRKQVKNGHVLSLVQY